MAKKNNNILFTGGKNKLLTEETLAFIQKRRLETKQAACEYCYKCMVDEFSCGNNDEDDDCIYCAKVLDLQSGIKELKNKNYQYKQNIKSLNKHIKTLRGFEEICKDQENELSYYEKRDAPDAGSEN